MGGWPWCAAGEERDRGGGSSGWAAVGIVAAVAAPDIEEEAVSDAASAAVPRWTSSVGKEDSASEAALRGRDWLRKAAESGVDGRSLLWAALELLGRSESEVLTASEERRGGGSGLLRAGCRAVGEETKPDMVKNGRCP